MRVEVRRSTQIKNTKTNEVSGNKTKIKIVKNKVAPPFREVEVDIMYGEGISYEGDLLELGSSDRYNVIEKSGSWYSYKGDKIGQGKENAKVFLKENPHIAKEMDVKIREIEAQLTGKGEPAPIVPETASEDEEE